MHLLRESCRPNRSQTPLRLARELSLPYSTVTGQLQKLNKGKMAFRRYVANPRKTPFKDEFLIVISVDIRAIWTERQKKARPSRTGPGSDRTSRLAEQFIEEIISGLSSDPEFKDELIVMDGVVLHGAPDRDIVLRVLSSDGLTPVGRYVRDVLLTKPGVRAATTPTVTWRYSADSHPIEA